MIAYLGLGSNLGDREAHLREAVASLVPLDEAVEVSPLYETEPVGGPPGQGPFLNCVVRLHTSLGPRDLLEVARRLEDRAGRVRTVRNGPRTLDVDVLLVDDLAYEDTELTVPHPRMHERAFVLAPLEDLDPGLVPAGWRERLGAVDEQVKRVGKLHLD